MKVYRIKGRLYLVQGNPAADKAKVANLVRQTENMGDVNLRSICTDIVPIAKEIGVPQARIVELIRKHHGAPRFCVKKFPIKKNPVYPKASPFPSGLRLFYQSSAGYSEGLGVIIDTEAVADPANARVRIRFKERGASQDKCTIRLKAHEVRAFIHSLEGALDPRP